MLKSGEVKIKLVILTSPFFRKKKKEEAGHF